MLILALEASGDTASCALWHDGVVCERVCAAGVPSSTTLLPAVAALLGEAGFALGAVEAVAFGAGPGSFTGVRVACALAQGIAYALGVPVLPISTLAAMALGSGASGKVLAVLDARMQEVYFECFAIESGELVSLDAPGVAPAAGVALPAAGDVWTVCGNALAASPLLRERIGERAILLPDVGPTAAAISRLGARMFVAGGGIAAQLAAPTYVRDRVAQTVAERLAAGGKA